MWIFWMLIGFAVLLWAGYVWMYALIHKYQHTIESYLILFAIMLISLILGWSTVEALAPTFSGLTAVLASSLTGFSYFIGLSYLAISIWCSLLARDFDEKIASLEEEQDSLTRRMERLRWQMFSNSGEDPQKTLERTTEAGNQWDGREAEISSIHEFVDRWQKGGGAARVRSLKIQEWKEELSQMDERTIMSQIKSQTEALKHEDDEVKKELGEVRLALLRLERLIRFSPSESRSSQGLPSMDSSKQVKSSLDENRIRERLQEIHRQTQVIDAMKREFFRGRIRLTWRRRK